MLALLHPTYPDSPSLAAISGGNMDRANLAQTYRGYPPEHLRFKGKKLRLLWLKEPHNFMAEIKHFGQN